MVQSRLFKGLSDPLDARIPSDEDDGKWKNAVSEIEDVEWEVFVGLVEFAYTGDYAGSLPRDKGKSVGVVDRGEMGTVEGKEEEEEPSAPIERSRLDEPAINAGTNHDNMWGSFGASKEKKKKKNVSSGWGVYECKPDMPAEETRIITRDQPMGRLLWHEFRKHAVSSLQSRSSKAAEVTIKECPSSAALLYHAKLCVLADLNLISSLRDQCLANLYKVLLGLELDLAKANDVLDLVYFVYTEDGVQRVADLQDVVLLYVTANIRIFRQDDRFRLMIEEIGQLGVDLVYKLTSTGDWT